MDLLIALLDAATETNRVLLQKNNGGIITTEEKSNLEKYLRVGQFLDLMEAKALLIQLLPIDCAQGVCKLVSELASVGSIRIYPAGPHLATTMRHTQDSR